LGGATSGAPQPVRSPLGIGDFAISAIAGAMQLAAIKIVRGQNFSQMAEPIPRTM
jgi:hypothetical protein